MSYADRGIVMAEWSNIITLINKNILLYILRFYAKYLKLYFSANSLWWMSKWKISRM